MYKKIGMVVIIAACIVLAVAAYLFFHTTHQKHHETHASFHVTHPWRQSVEIENVYVAQIKSIQHIELRSFEKGYLQHTFIDEGQSVKKGQKLFQVMPLILQAEFDETKAEYEVKKIEYDNTKRLFKKHVVSDNELALTKAKLDKAKAKMNLKKAHLQFSLIKAPFDGIIDRFRVRLGSLIDEGELLTTMSDNSKVWVYFNVSEVDYLNFMSKVHENKKRPIKLLLANGEPFNQKGKIDTVEADFNNETGNIAFRASFVNPDGLLRHGQTGNIVLTEQYTDALVIPQKTAFEVLDKRYVYVVDKDGMVKSKEIHIVHEVAHLYVIQSGLNEHDMILLDGLGQVDVGEKIKTTFLSKDDVIASLNLSVN